MKFPVDSSKTYFR